MGRGMGKERGKWTDRRWLWQCVSTFNQVKVWVEEKGEGRDWRWLWQCVSNFNQLKVCVEEKGKGRDCNMVRVGMGKGEVTQ